MSDLKYIFLAVIAMTFIACGSKKKTVVRENKTDYDNSAFRFIKNEDVYTVLDKAKKEGKLVFVDVYTDWCLPCKMMDQDVFSDQELGKYFRKNFITYKVNAEKGSGPSVKVAYNIGSYPTLLFLDADGTVLERKGGSAYHTELRQLAESAIAKHKNQVN